MKKIPFLSLSILIVGFCACISCSYFFSNILLSAGLFSNIHAVSTEQQTFFAISIKSGQSEKDLSAQKALLQSQDGAGYVLKQKDNFQLLASIYENKADAELVKNNLLSKDVDCEVLAIEVSSKSIDGNFSSDEKTVLLQCLKAEIEVFKKLYDVAISLDTEILDNTKAKLECNQIYSSHISNKANFETVFKNKSIESVEKQLKNIEALLSNLIAENFESENQTFSSLIKLTYCKILLG